MRSSKTLYFILSVIFISVLFFDLDKGLYFYTGNISYSIGQAFGYAASTILITFIFFIFSRIFGKVPRERILFIANIIGILVLLGFIVPTVNQLLGI